MLTRIDHVNLTVTNLAESIRFYGTLFDFKVVERGARDDDTPWAILRVGESMLCIYEHPERKPAKPWTEGSELHRVNHLGFRISNPPEFLRRLKEADVQPLYGGLVEWPNSDSWYILDPSGHEIEVVSWHENRVSFAHATESLGD